MSNKDLKVGDRVRLSPTSRYVGNVENPLNVLGTVICIDFISLTGIEMCRVDWDNDEWNRYRLADSDLILIKDDNDFFHSQTLDTVTW